ADTPERSARSRRERSIASRSARTRGPTGANSATALKGAYVITYACTLLLGPREPGHLPRAALLLEGGVARAAAALQDGGCPVSSDLHVRDFRLLDRGHHGGTRRVPKAPYRLRAVAGLGDGLDLPNELPARGG